MEATETLFDRVCRMTIGHEGDALSLEAADRGNWTEGAVGVGELRGSRFGIIAALTALVPATPAG